MLFSSPFKTQVLVWEYDGPFTHRPVSCLPPTHRNDHMTLCPCQIMELLLLLPWTNGNWWASHDTHYIWAKMRGEYWGRTRNPYADISPESPSHCLTVRCFHSLMNQNRGSSCICKLIWKWRVVWFTFTFYFRLHLPSDSVIFFSCHFNIWNLCMNKDMSVFLYLL